MTGETDLCTLLSQMRPRLSETVYTFATVARSEAIPDGLDALGTFVEDEGVTIIATLDEIERAGLAHSGGWAKISLEAHSALSAVGLTASITTTLAHRGISANVVAAFFHDHIFVPWDRRHAAMEALHALGRPENQER